MRWWEFLVERLSIFELAAFETETQPAIVAAWWPAKHVGILEKLFVAAISAVQMHSSIACFRYYRNLIMSAPGS
jgi:hypothetical protein